jgi:uncharacterized protein YkwD
VTAPISVARRWPPRSRLSGVVAASLLASLFAFGASGAQPAPVAATTSSPWYQVEVYYLKLVNCTRTGGWVRADGSCAGYGSGHYSKYVAPLKLGPKLSAVSRSWAKHIAILNVCAHGDPGARMRAAGFNGWAWGENIGCGWGSTTHDVYAAVLASHRAMQAEKSTNGGHWKNIKNPRFNLLGVGIWRYGSRVRVVNDFYHAG